MGNNKSKIKEVTYQCPHCKQECKLEKKIAHLTIEKFIDQGTGDEHIHDPNQGFIKIICKKGHMSEHPYYHKCWCGWTNQLDTK